MGSVWAVVVSRGQQWERGHSREVLGRLAMVLLHIELMSARVHIIVEK